MIKMNGFAEGTVTAEFASGIKYQEGSPLNYGT